MGFRQHRGVPAGETQDINNLKMSLFCLWYQEQPFLCVPRQASQWWHLVLITSCWWQVPRMAQCLSGIWKFLRCCTPFLGTLVSLLHFLRLECSFQVWKELWQLGPPWAVGTQTPPSCQHSPNCWKHRESLILWILVLFHSWGEVCESVWKRNLCCFSCHGSQSAHLEFDFWQSKVYYPGYAYRRTALTSPSCGWGAHDCIFFLRYKGMTSL